MAKASLRKASLSCLALWAAIWLLFMLMRFSTFDIRRIPGNGEVMLCALGVVLLAPILAAGLAVAALVRQPKTPLNWLTLACAVAVFLGQGFLFLITSWL